MPALGQALRWSLISLAALLLTVATLAGGFWLWAGSDGSLASSLQFLQHTVLSDQALEARGVTGSLRQGGRIGALNWQQDGLRVQASEIQITWQPSALWQGELHLSQLSVAHLSIQDQRVAVPNAPAAPPAQLGLPFKVDAQVQVGTLVWQGARPAALEQVSFHYIFNSYSHLIEKGYGLFSSN